MPLQLIESRRVVLPGERSALYRGAARGDFVRVIRGVFASADGWAALTPEEQHLERLRAATLLEPDVVFTRWSAAVLHRLP
jgi:hypothetical protein